MNFSYQKINLSSLSKAFLSILIAFSFLVLAFPLLLPVEGALFFIILGTIWLGFQIWKFETFPVSKVLLIFILQVLYLFVFTQYSKPIPATIFQIQRILIIILLALLSFTTLRSDEDRKPWENALILFALVLSLSSIYELFKWYSQYSMVNENLRNLPITKISYRLSGSFLGHPNPLAGYINFVWPIVLIRLYDTPKKSHKLLWGILLFTLFLVMFYTSSRGGWLGTFAGIAIILGAIILRVILTSNKRIGLLNIFQQYLKIFLLGGFAALLLVIIILYKSTLTGSQALGFSSRSGIWIPAINAIAESPIIGHGIGSFPIVYTGADQLPPGFLAPHAHNLWLQIGAGYGIVGVLFICVILILFSVQAIKATKSQLTNQIYFPIAYLAGGAAFITQHLFDFLLTNYRYSLSFVLIMVLLTRYSTSFGSWKLQRRGFSIVIGSILVLLVVFHGAASAQISGFNEFLEISELANNQNGDALQNKICSLADEKEKNALYQFECSMAIAKVISAETSNSGIINQNLLSSAISYQRSGQDFNPYWAIQEANLAVLYWENDQKSEALLHMRNAVDAAPKAHILLINLGWMEEQLGHEAEAMNYYTRTLRLSPWMRRSLFAQQSTLFQVAAENLDNWIELEHLWEDWYAEFDITPNSFDHIKGVMALFGNKSEKATKQLEISLSQSPGSFTRNVYLALAYQQNGQTDRAFDLAQVAHRIYEESNTTKNSFYIEIIGSIMLENGEFDIAYELLSDAFEKRKNQTIYDFYYSYIYGQRIIMTDISPFLIMSGGVLAESYSDWLWLAEEANQRGDQELSKNIELWLSGLQGIAR